MSRAQIAPEVTDKIEQQKPPRRTWPWAVGVFGFGAIGAALAVVLASQSGDAAAPLPAAFLDHAIVRNPVPVSVPVPVPVVVQAPVVVETPTKSIHHVQHVAPVPALGSAAATPAVPTPPGDAFGVQHPGQTK